MLWSTVTRCIQATVSQDDRSDSFVKLLHPVFVLAWIIGLPFETRFDWLSFRNIWLLAFLLYCSTLTVLTAKEQLKTFGVGSVGAVMFYLLSTTYVLYFIWLAIKWPEIKSMWIRLEEKMVSLPKVRAVSLTTAVTTIYAIVGLSEHALSILDNLRRLNKYCIKNDNPEMMVFEMYYRVNYREIFSLIDFAIWKGILNSMFILMLTIVWTFTDVFLMCLSLAVATRVRQLYFALQQSKGKEMSVEYWKTHREIYLSLYFLTKSLDDKISLLLLLTLGNNLYSICIMLLNALSMKTNQDYLQTAYYSVSFFFVVMRLIGTTVSAAKINDTSKELLQFLFAVPSQSYSIEAHRLLIHITYEPLTFTAFRFFSVNWSTVLKIAGTILTYEIVLVQNWLDAEETVRRPTINCNITYH